MASLHSASSLVSSPADTDALRARLTQIDAEMNQLGAKLDELAAVRKPVADALDAMIYPVLTIPPEIIADVFMAYVAPSDDATRRTRGARGPLLLAHVCSAWRAIALNLPSLWSTLKVGGQGAGTDRLVQYSLERAGNRPLILDLTALRVQPYLAPAVTPSLEQCRALSIKLPSAVRTDGGQGCWPILQSLTVAGAQHRDDDPPLTRFSGAPQLSEVMLYNLPIPTSPWLSLPWEQLTRLEIGGPRMPQIPECVDLLRRTSNLESLSVVLLETRWYQMPTPVRLARLHTLEFRSRYQRGESGVEETLVLLRHLTLPALKHLITLIPDASLSILRTFLARSACDLHSLSLDGARSSLSSSVSALEAISTLSNVSIPEIAWSSTDLAVFFTRLALDPDGFLPSMQTLNLERCMPAVPLAALVAMLEARWHGRSKVFGGGLNSFRIVRDTKGAPDKPMDPLLAARLRALVDDGLGIHIETAHRAYAQVPQIPANQLTRF
ncbi:hypothetical protein FB451DRAFT_1100777 [Mycena latifolia]|nr:hypothetical protein FB451DRAFT_1100777 [Mycena latifolia]